jgi:hypothetical protein
VIPIIFLSAVPEIVIINSLKLLTIYTKAKQDYNKKEISTILHNISETLNQSALTRRLLSDLNHTVSSTIQKCQEQLISLEIQIKRSIEGIDIKESYDINLLDYIKKDHELVISIYQLGWTEIKHNKFIHDNITISLKPLKNKTKVILLKYNDQTIVERFKKSKNIYMINLCEDIIDFIKTLL